MVLCLIGYFRPTGFSPTQGGILRSLIRCWRFAAVGIYRMLEWSGLHTIRINASTLPCELKNTYSIS
jgi:hypothetical protein